MIRQGSPGWEEENDTLMKSIYNDQTLSEGGHHGHEGYWPEFLLQKGLKMMCRFN